MQSVVLNYGFFNIVAITKHSKKCIICLTVTNIICYQTTVFQ